MPKLKLTKPSTIKILYQMLYDMHRIFTKNDLTYWVDAGTLLGAVRHKGVIPWDDDLDVGILSKDIKKFLRLKNQFKKCGYSICEVWFGYKIYYTKRKKVKAEGETQCYSFPFIDVFIYKKISGNKYHFSRKAARETWPKETWYKQNLFPLKKYQFGSYKVFGPNKYINHFNRYFGKDWNKIAYREYDHQAEISIDKVKVKLTKQMRQPAKPIIKVRNKRCIKC